MCAKKKEKIKNKTNKNSDKSWQNKYTVAKKGDK